MESKAREFEVLENVNLHKLLHLMEKKEKKIQALEATENEQNVTMDYIHKVAEDKVKMARKRASDEQRVKLEALNKINELRNRTDLL